MDLLLDNLPWMSWNIFLAVLALFFGYIFLKFKNLYIKILFFILWLFFVPNTIYLITDMQYIPEQFMEIEPSFKILLLIQYFALLILGILTFILGFYPLDKMLFKYKKSKNFRMTILIVINYLIAFGVALGRFERINSWDIVVNFKKVLESSVNLLNTVEIVLFIFLLGTFCNLVYFFFRRAKYRR